MSGAEVKRAGGGRGGGRANAERTDAAGVEFDGNGALEEIDRDDEVIPFANGEEDTAQAGQGTGFDFYGGTGLDSRPGEGGKAGGHDEADAVDLGLADLDGSAAGADEAVEAGGGVKGEDATGKIEAAEEVAGEHGEFGGGIAARAGSLAAGGKEGLEALVFENGADGFFRAGPDLKGVPGGQDGIEPGIQQTDLLSVERHSALCVFQCNRKAEGVYGGPLGDENCRMLRRGRLGGRR